MRTRSIRRKRAPMHLPNAPYLLHAPTAAALPLVLDSPHSGEHYPDDFDHAPPRAVVRQAEDTHVARLYRAAPRTRRDADRGRLSARLHRRQPEPRRPRSRDARRAVAGAARRVAQDAAGDRTPLARCARRRADVRRASSPSAKCERASTAGTGRTTRRSTTRSRRCIGASGRSGTSTAIRCRPSAMRMPTIPAVRARTSCSATVMARRARRDSRRSSRKRVRGLGLLGRDQRSVQRRGNRAAARPPGGGAAQPADRAQSAPLHGRGDARAQRALSASSKAISGGWLVAVAAMCEWRLPRLVRPLDRSVGAAAKLCRSPPYGELSPQAPTIPREGRGDIHAVITEEP